MKSDIVVDYEPCLVFVFLGPGKETDPTYAQ